MAKSKIREHFVARIAILLGSGRARSGRPLSASAGDSRPARGSRRRPFGGGRIRTRQAPTADPQSIPKTVPQSPSSDRVVAGLCALFMRPGRLIRSAIVLRPSTLLSLHRALIQRKYRRLFSSKTPTKPGPKGPRQDVIAAVVDMKQGNRSWGCPRIAQQITLAFGIPINKDMVRRILAARYQPKPDAAGPSW